MEPDPTTKELIEIFLNNMKTKKYILKKDVPASDLCDLKAFGLRIRAARETTGLTQTAFAKKIDLQQVSMSRLEKGKMKPSFDTLCAIAKATKKPMSFFFGEEPPKPADPEIEILKKQMFELKEAFSKYGK